MLAANMARIGEQVAAKRISSAGSNRSITARRQSASRFSRHTLYSIALCSPACAWVALPWLRRSSGLSSDSILPEEPRSTAVNANLAV